MLPSIDKGWFANLITWPKHVPEVIARLACGSVCLVIHIWKKKLRIKQLNFSKERVRFPFCHASLVFLIICSCGQVYTTSYETLAVPFIADSKAQKNARRIRKYFKLKPWFLNKTKCLKTQAMLPEDWRISKSWLLILQNLICIRLYWVND